MGIVERRSIALFDTRDATVRALYRQIADLLKSYFDIVVIGHEGAGAGAAASR